MGRWVSGTASEFAAVGGARHARWPSCVGCNRNRRGKSKKAKALAPPPSCQPLFLYAGPVFVALARGFLAGFGGAPVPVVVAVVVVVVVLVMVVVWDERLSLCITFSMHRGAFSDATMLPAHCCNLFVAARFVGLHLEKLNQESALGNKIIIRMKP